MGRQGDVLFAAMSNIPGLHFHAVCDIWDYSRQKGLSRVKCLQGHAPNGYVDIDDMLASEKGLDAVVIAVPAIWHAPCTGKFLSEAPVYWVNRSALKKEPIVFTPDQLSV